MDAKQALLEMIHALDGEETDRLWHYMPRVPVYRRTRPSRQNPQGRLVVKEHRHKTDAELTVDDILKAWKECQADREGWNDRQELRDLRR